MADTERWTIMGYEVYSERNAGRQPAWENIAIGPKLRDAETVEVVPASLLEAEQSRREGVVEELEARAADASRKARASAAVDGPEESERQFLLEARVNRDAASLVRQSVSVGRKS